MVDHRDEQRRLIRRHRRDHPAQGARIDQPRLDLRAFAPHRQQAVFVVAVVGADRALPHRLAGFGVEGDDDPGLAGADRQLPAPGLGQDRRVLEVPVVEVVRRLLVVPLHLAGLGVELDHRVGVEVRPGPARAPGKLGRAGERRRVAGAEVHEALLVEGRWVPEPAAGVEFGVLLRPEALGNGVEVSTPSSRSPRRAPRARRRRRAGYSELSRVGTVET